MHLQAYALTTLLLFFTAAPIPVLSHTNGRSMNGNHNSHRAIHKLRSINTQNNPPPPPGVNILLTSASGSGCPGGNVDVKVSYSRAPEMITVSYSKLSTSVSSSPNTSAQELKNRKLRRKRHFDDGVDKTNSANDKNTNEDDEDEDDEDENEEGDDGDDDDDDDGGENDDKDDSNEDNDNDYQGSGSDNAGDYSNDSNNKRDQIFPIAARNLPSNMGTEPSDTATSSQISQDPVVATGTTGGQKECSVTVQLEQPAGWQFAIQATDFTGEANLFAGETASVHDVVAFIGKSGVYDAHSEFQIPGPREGTFQGSGNTMQDFIIYSACKENVTIMFNTTLRLDGIGENNQSGYIGPGQNTQSFQIAHNLQWKQCQIRDGSGQNDGKRVPGLGFNEVEAPEKRRKRAAVEI